MRANGASTRAAWRASPRLRASILGAIALWPLGGTLSCQVTALRPQTPRVAGERDVQAAASREAAPGRGTAVSAERDRDEAPSGSPDDDTVAPAENPVVDSLEGATRAVARGALTAATRFLEPFVAAQPANLEARLLLVRTLAMTHGHDQALARLREAPSRSPASTWVEAELLVATGRVTEALAVTERGLAEHPGDLPLRGGWLAILGQLGRQDEPAAKAAMNELYDAYEAGLAKTPDALLAVARAALLRRGSGAAHDANRVLEEAADLAPVAQGSAIGDRIALTRAQLFLDKHDPTFAKELVSSILARHRDHADALALLAQIELSDLAFSRAEAAAKRALARQPALADARAVLASVALVEGDRTRAKSLAERARADHPRHARASAVLAALAHLEATPRVFTALEADLREHHAAGPGFWLTLSELLGYVHLYANIEDVLGRAGELASRHPQLKGARGLNLLRLGREEEARALLAEAARADPFDRRTLNVLRLYDEVVDRDYVLEVHDGLTFRFPKADAEFLRAELLPVFARAKQTLDRHYGFNPGPLRFEIFADHEAFSIRTIGVPDLGALAVCFGRVITFVGPYSGTYDFHKVIWHELAHVYAIAKSRGRVPRWFTEGLSEWEASLADPSWSRRSAELLTRARAAGQMKNLGNLELAFLRAQSPTQMDVAYATATYAVRFLGTRFGRKKLIAMLEGYGAGKTTEVVLREITSFELAVLEPEFSRYVDHELSRKRSGFLAGDATSDDGENATLVRAGELAQAGDRTGAKRLLSRMIESGHDGYAPRMALAALEEESHAQRAALAHLEKAHGFFTESIDPLVQIAEIALSTGDLESAKRALVRALAIASDAPGPAARLLALALLSDDAAREDLASARLSATGPLHPAALFGKAAVLARQVSARPEAERLADRAEQSAASVRVPDARIIAAMANLRLGRREAALRFGEAVLAEPKLPSVVRERLEVLLRRRSAGQGAPSPQAPR